MIPARGEHRSYWRQWIAALGASSTMLGVNLDVVWDAGIDYYRSKWSLLAGSSLVILGAILGAAMADTFGRRTTLLATSIFVIPRMAALYFTAELSEWISMLFISLGSGITCVVVPLYISEIPCAGKNRGNLMVTQQSVHYLGVLAVWIIHSVIRFYGDVYHEANRLSRMSLLALSILFHIQILSVFPETPQYLNWTKKYQEAANSLAFYEGINPVRLTIKQASENRSSVSPDSNDEEEVGSCECMREIFRFENRRSMAIILSLIAIRWASGQEWILFILVNMIAVYHKSGSHLFTVVVFFAASLIVSLLVLLSVRFIGRKSFLLTVIGISFIAALIGGTSLAKHYCLLVGILYVQCIAHYFLIGITLAYLGEFFLINVRSIAIAMVIIWEVMMRSFFFLIGNFCIGPAFLRPEYTPDHAYFNCAVLVIAFGFVFIFFPKTNKVSSSRIMIKTLPNGESLLIEELATI